MFSGTVNSPSPFEIMKWFAKIMAALLLPSIKIWVFIEYSVSSIALSMSSMSEWIMLSISSFTLNSSGMGGI